MYSFGITLCSCLIFGTDGLWNVISAKSAVEIARRAEVWNVQTAYAGNDGNWANPSKCLVDKALEQWSTTRMRADNTSVVIVMIDPPGPPKREVLRNSPQQFLVENHAFATGSAGDNQTPQVLVNPNSNCTLFDHNVSKTLIDLAPAPPKVASATASTSVHSNRSSAPVEPPMPPPQSPTPFGYTFDENGDAASMNLSYEFAYAAAFNPMIHPVTCDPIEPPAKTSTATAAADAAAAATSDASTSVSLPAASVAVAATPDDLQTLASSDADVSYSLTCLETRRTMQSASRSTAQFSSQNDREYSPCMLTLNYYLHSRTSAVSTEQQHQQAGPQLPHYESIASTSFMSQSCGLMQPPLDDSVQAALMNNIPTAEPTAEAMDVTEPPESIKRTDQNASVANNDGDEAEDDEDCVDDYMENFRPGHTDAEDATPATTPPPPPPPAIQTTSANIRLASQIPALLDATIQIHEITSSSPKRKEKENNSVNSTNTTAAGATPTNCTPTAGGYRMPMALRSAKRSAMRMTRSSKLPRTPSFDSRTKKPKTITKRSVAHKSPRIIGRPDDVHLVPSRVSVRHKSSSSSSAAKTAQTEAAPSNAKRNATTNDSANTAATIGSSPPASTLANRTLRSRNILASDRYRQASSSPAASALSATVDARSVAVLPRETRTARLRDRVKSQYQLMQTSRSKSLVRTLSASARKLMAVAVASVAPPSSSSVATSSIRTRGAMKSSSHRGGTIIRKNASPLCASRLSRQ